MNLEDMLKIIREKSEDEKLSEISHWLPMLADETRKLQANIDRLTARNAELVEAVRALLKPHKQYWKCIWCGEQIWKEEIHAPDCPRQRAAALVEEVKE